MTNLYSASNAIYDLYNGKNTTECARVFANFMSLYDIEIYAVLETDIGARQRDVMLAWSWTDEWRRFCRQSGHLHHDPLLALIEKDCGAFSLSERARDPVFRDEVNHILQRFSAFGWRDALCVTIHRGGLRYGVTSLICPRPIERSEDKAELTAVSFAYHQRLRSLVPQDGFPVAPAGLSQSEIDCLKMLSSGLSDIKIGESLGLGGSLVHARIESAKQKLAAQNRSELVGLAHSLAIIA